VQHRPHLERDEFVRPPVPGQVELGHAIVPADLQLREFAVVVGGGAHHLHRETDPLERGSDRVEYPSRAARLRSEQVDVLGRPAQQAVRG
jgi:hypothetical protein